MARTISVKTVNSKTAKPLPGDKSLGIETYIRFYEIEDGDNYEEGEEA